MASAPARRAAAMMASASRYDERGSAGPIGSASDTPSTWSASRSASEYTATGAMPISGRVSAMRPAISPRFAIRACLDMRAGQAPGARRGRFSVAYLNPIARGAPRAGAFVSAEDERLRDQRVRALMEPHEIHAGRQSEPRADHDLVRPRAQRADLPRVDPPTREVEQLERRSRIGRQAEGDPQVARGRIGARAQEGAGGRRPRRHHEPRGPGIEQHRNP